MFHSTFASASPIPGLARASLVLVPCLVAAPAVAQELIWVEQFGSSSFDFAFTAAPDGAGGVYVGGRTMGDLGGPSSGGTDAWLARLDPSGGFLWIRQWGSTFTEYATDSAPDGGGGVYVGGRTSGSLAGPNQGSDDAWFARYDGSGNQLWIRQLGTSAPDRLEAACAEGSGDVYVGGTTEGALAGPLTGFADGWFARFDGAGNQLWARQTNAPSSEGVYALALDGSGGIFVAGTTSGSFGGPSAGGGDAWVARHDGAGNPLWIRQIGSSGSDRVSGAVPDGSGGVYIGGDTDATFGAPLAGERDVWLARYDAAGNLIWLRQFGTAGTEDVNALVTGSSGVMLCGRTEGLLGGTGAGGSGDTYLARFDAAGSQLWVQQYWDTPSGTGDAAASDGAGGIFAAGFTLGDLAGPSAGAADVWVGRFDAACQEGTAYCVSSSTSIPGCQAAIAGVGVPSLANASGFAVHSGAVPGANLGLCLFSNTDAAFNTLGTLGGKLCAKSPLFRSAPVSCGGAAGQCNGDYEFTLQKLIDASPIVVSGATIRAQIWARDPANPDGFLLSNALEFVVCP